MEKYQKLIFVCTGNTCRSPMAEAIYRNLEKVSERKVLSRGLVVLFPEPINPKAEVVLKKHDLEIMNHVSKGLKTSDIDDNTIILTMTESQKRKILELYPGVKDIYTIKEYAGEIGDVVDPYGGTLVEYEECYIELARLVKKTVYKLNEEE
ncbi:low molecular weight protein arginine phosphatase [Lachnospiraceae bacterium MD1]|jgi:protein-tyrosine phosphatase|uniref:Low molecular weight protein arginine phosphatase n=1 Tax=Variimorphobacter saccharofermentans TaxID=2755051 RepID=A0A839K5B3_9FIRM|nr:low molecular weight protein arginine phosphatase [Variimorphobacter saccharofermentans]MBB2184548.1 low molecular weight protein arginine phosphatase [Variimorphobacter saccharofermentans]